MKTKDSRLMKKNIQLDFFPSEDDSRKRIKRKISGMKTINSKSRKCEKKEEQGYFYFY